MFGGIRVVLLEPDCWRRLGIEAVLEDSKKFQVVDGDAGADVVLLPYRLLNERGLLEIARLRERYLCAVLVYADSDDWEDDERAAQVLRAGAHGFYVENGTPAQLAAAVELVSEGRIWGSHEALRRAVEQERGGEDLHSDDLALLRLLEKGLTNKEIGQRVGVAEATVKSRMNRLYKRFRVTSRLQLLSAAIRRGLVGGRVADAGSPRNEC